MDLIKEIEKFWFHEGHLNENQRDFIIKTVSELKPKYCIETGFASGRSAATVLCAAKPKKLVSVDIDLNYISGARDHSQKLLENFKNFKIVEGSSSSILKNEFFVENFPKGIDFAFIDGDHLYQGAKSDIKAIYEFMNVGAVMLVDDYYSCAPDGCSMKDVDMAVDDFCKEKNIIPEKWHNNGKGFAIIRK